MVQDKNLSQSNKKIDEELGKEIFKPMLIGSTRIEKFQICFKLCKECKIEPTEFSQPQCFSFNIYIQAVDKYLNNVKDVYDETKEFNNSSIVKETISVSGVKQSINDSANLNFIDDILFDFEVFGFN